MLQKLGAIKNKSLYIVEEKVKGKEFNIHANM